MAAMKTTSTLGSQRTIRLQAEEHPLVSTDDPRSIEEHCLQLMHRKAYEVTLDIVRGKEVLDLGCNVGYGTHTLSRAATRAVGVDVSEHSVTQARKRYAGEPLQFEVYDGVTLPFESASFDVVTSFQVIEHVHDVGPYLAEIARVLRPDGVAVFTTPNAGIRLEPGLKPCNRFHVREYEPGQLEAELTPYFASVRVQGLFAVPALYAVEFDRCQRRLQIARWRAGRASRLRSASDLRLALTGIAMRVLPEAVLGSLATLAERLMRHRSARGKQFQRYTTRDLHYQAESLREALDLMAVCRTRSNV
jgi:SAM-dependent methyltransferase